MNKLSITKDKEGLRIKLDDKNIDCVKEYQVKSSANGSTELSLVIDVYLTELSLEKGVNSGLLV